MTNKVVHVLYKVFRDAGFLSLRFNFRGAGQSAGTHGGGLAEQADVAAGFEMLSELQGANAEALPTVIGGFSFGAAVGLAYAAGEPACTHRVGIGLPIAPELAGDRAYDFSFLSGQDRRPLYLVVGEEDSFCPLDLFLAQVERLRHEGVPVEAVVVPGANHFFDRLGHVLRQELERIAAAILGLEPKPRGFPAKPV